MSAPLKLGLAGLGTVGISALERLLSMENELAVKTSRGIRVQAVSARNRNKDRGVDLSGLDWYSRSG